MARESMGTEGAVMALDPDPAPGRRIEFERRLNPEQLAAVTAGDGPVLILAAAGTGKTRTLVYRVAYLLERGALPETILLLTFTNKAAKEMLDRAQSLVGHGVSGMWGGTFHHMANRVLRRHAECLEYGPDYTIMDREDSLSLVRECMGDLRRRMPDAPKPEVLLSLFSTAANTETSVGPLAERRFEDHPVVVEDILKVHREYRSRKRQLNAMDFDDLLVNGLRLFREHPDVLRRYQERFQHTLVDEYQDTNTIQAEWVDRISAGHGNLLVVGDDFQSIYGWRGADYRNIITFTDRYPGAKVYLLETNYRSVPEILAVANACIAANPGQFPKQLRTTREAYRRPRVARMRDGEAQARYVVEEFRRLRREGYRAADIAVLYRAHYQCMELQMHLSRERLPYRITSGVRFFEQAHIKDVCAIVRILQNPGDQIAFTRLLCLLPRVGVKTAERIWRNLGGRFEAGDPGPRRALREALPADARAVWAKIDPVLDAWESQDLKSDAGEVIHRFLEAFYQDHAARSFENHARRIDDIRELVLFTAGFETVEQFLSDVALMTNLDAEAEESAREEGGDVLRLSTVHQAKGLEWSAVIVLWATEGMFPQPRALDASVEGEAEERRLFYVAVTRAKDELLLCAPEVRRKPDGGVMYCAPSRFLADVGGGLVEDVRVGFI